MTQPNAKRVLELHAINKDDFQTPLRTYVY